MTDVSTETSIKDAYVDPQEQVLDPDSIDPTLLDRMPQPTGWRLLVLPYRGKGRTSGGILLTDQQLDEDQVQTVVGYVLKQGPLCYADTDKFPDGPWCDEKEWVIFPRYAGSRFRIEGGEVRILNDDEVLATIKNPDDILSY
jgi:co-chaperonin GroES (HSP10)|tara:strand:- start:66 stop:491 length:426 start_codon:yes stop_codon:yes gene_type:complete